MECVPSLKHDWHRGVDSHLAVRGNAEQSREMCFGTFESYSECNFKHKFIHWPPSINTWHLAHLYR